MMKTSILTLLFCVVFVSLSIAKSIELTDEQREQWSKLNVRSLPALYQQALLEVQAMPEGRDDIGSWCCKNGNPARVKIITKTYIRWEPTGATQSVVVGHDDCGFGGWSTCTVYGIQHIPTSHIEYGHDLVPDLDASQCPDRHVVCCQSLVPVGDYCLSIPQFNRLVMEWTRLQAISPNLSLADMIVSYQNNGLPS